MFVGLLCSGLLVQFSVSIFHRHHRNTDAAFFHVAHHAVEEVAGFGVEFVEFVFGHLSIWRKFVYLLSDVKNYKFKQLLRIN